MMAKTLVLVLAVASTTGCKAKDLEAPRVEYVEPPPTVAPPELVAIPADPTIEVIEEKVDRLPEPDADTKLVTLREGRHRVGDVIFGLGSEAVTIKCLADPEMVLKQVDVCVRRVSMDGRTIASTDCLFSETRFLAPDSRETTLIVPRDAFGNGVPADGRQGTAVFTISVVVETVAKSPITYRGTATLEYEIP